MQFKNAFRCKNCPESSNRDGCPCWIELIWKHDTTGETTVERGCYFQLMPKLILESVKAANISSAHACQVRNTLYRGFQYLASSAEKYPMLKEE